LSYTRNGWLLTTVHKLPSSTFTPEHTCLRGFVAQNGACGACGALRIANMRG